MGINKKAVRNKERMIRISENLSIVSIILLGNILLNRKIESAIMEIKIVMSRKIGDEAAEAPISFGFFKY